MKNKPEELIAVSVIFVNYNTCQMTLTAIGSVYKFTTKLNFEIIVVDNASADNSVEEIRKNFPKVTILESKKNIGFGRANNLAMEIAKGKYYFLLNTDTYLVNNAIELLGEFMENPDNANVAILGGQLLTSDGELNLSAGSFPNFKMFVKSSFWRHFYKKTFYNGGQYHYFVPSDSEPYEVDYVSGADFFVRSDIIKIAGKFNPCFFMYFEETELTYRIKKILPDTKVMVLPTAKIVHIGQGSSLESIKSLKFKLQYLKSKSLYFRFQNGYHAGFMVYFRGLFTIFFKR